MNKKPAKTGKTREIYDELHWDDLTDRTDFARLFKMRKAFLRTIINRYDLGNLQKTIPLRELLSVETFGWLKTESQKLNMTFSEIVTQIIEQHRNQKINFKLSDANLEWLRKEAKENNVSLSVMLDAIVLDSRLESEE